MRARADVLGEAQVRHLVDVAAGLDGGLAVLVNNASAPHPTGDGIAGWMDSIDTDFLGALHATRFAIDAMRGTGGGSIVNVASIARSTAASSSGGRKIVRASSNGATAATARSRRGPEGEGPRVGGVFFKSRDPKALGAWYQRWLGVEFDGHGALG
jgi:3-oxoacyl-[acyl-carrier protein] reductase